MSVTMDRYEADWGMVERGYNAHILGEAEHKFTDATVALKTLKTDDVSDQYIPAFVIVDEAQSLERNVLLTVLSRIGADSRVVLTHDVGQRDNLRVGRFDGVVAVVEKLKGHPLFAHVTLTRSERSPIAALVTELLEDGTL